METKDRNRGTDRKRPQTGRKQPAPRKRPGQEQEAPQKRPRPAAQAAPDKQRRQTAQRRTAQRQRAAEEEMRWAMQHQQQTARPTEPQPNEDLPQEEVHRPAPSQERHAPKEQPQTRERPVRARQTRGAGEQSRGDASTRVPTKRRIRKPRSNAPVAVYTQPAPFNLNRLLIQLLSIAAVVLALTMALSIFFKVEVITVSGADTYSEWAVREASGIAEGDSLLTFSRARAAARIRAELPYVDDVRFGIKLPNTVMIDIVELEVVYAIQDTMDAWWLITSEGRVVEQTDSISVAEYTQIQGVKILNPEVNATAVAQADQPEDATAPTDASGATMATVDPNATVPVAETNADRLQAAIEILQALETNDIVGEVATINVDSLADIELWYGTRYRVELGDNTRLAYKITCMQDAILQLSDYEMGVLDVSFIFWTDKVEYAPFND